MQNALTYLGIVRRRGERKQELRRVHRQLQNREFYLLAYAKLYANKGALTPGVDSDDTVDDMSLARIDRIIQQLKAGTYQWRPVRRTYIPKRRGGTRPLGVPTWSDKLLQEVLRMILEAYYEPQFSALSCGFRPGRGCHTALRYIQQVWAGTKWFIEGDIKGCFDNIEHNKLLEIIGRSIKDERLLKLLRGMLDAGYLEDWIYHQTHSGTPQGGIISPLLSNIFLNELDTYIEQELIPQFTRGAWRQHNPEYRRLQREMQAAHAEGDKESYRALERERRETPSGDPNDPDYRRLRYVRYADDFLLGFVGPKAEAEEIKRQVGKFLQSIGLTLSEEKTLVTHATEGRARFLGYEVYAGRCDSRMTTDKNGVWRRCINGRIMLSVPRDVAQEKAKRYTQKGQPHARAELQRESDYTIVLTYGLEFQGLVNYYVLAYDVSKRLGPLKYIYETSLVKTLAAKHKRSVKWVYKKYRRTVNGVKAIVVEVPREGKKPLVTWFGAQPIRHDQKARIEDTKIRRVPFGHSELIDRLLAEKCELCGRETADLRGHHVQKLADLKKRYTGRRNPPRWAERMIALRRKTLMVCPQCHRDIHAGRYDGPKLK